MQFTDFFETKAMKSFVNKAMTNGDVVSDIKTLIPDAGLRRRMSSVIKTAVATAVECVGGVDAVSAPDAIITATGWGCMTDSERFLRNVIEDREQLLNPTPFIQSTFNTVGGQIALLRHNHCYNMTYVNRSHSFEDALLDAMMRIEDGESEEVLLGAFDEQTPSQQAIMRRMGLLRNRRSGEGAMFTHLTATVTEESVAQVVNVDFPGRTLTEDECRQKYAGGAGTEVLYQGHEEYGLVPTAAAFCYAKAVRMIADGVREVVVYNEYLGAQPAVMVLQCVGY